MRLFTAILFNNEINNSLYLTVEKLKTESKGGTFTAKDNLHLTVNFIGETKRFDEVKQAMQAAVDQLHAGKFILSIRGFGRFKRREGDIYWVGVEKENNLWKLQKELVKELKEAGFYDIDDMEYTPHLTLGRRVKVREGFNAVQFEEGITPMQMEVCRLSLMNSERIEGKLVYTEIYSVELKKD
jgi:2'-5' RNA ligase